MRRAQLVAAALAGALLAAPVAAQADTPSLCADTDGPYEYQATLGTLVSDTVGPPPMPDRPSPPPTTRRGAISIASDALGAQFAGGWLNSRVQGWVVGLAPGPLDVAAARAAIVDRLAAHFTPSELAYLADRLHIDPQPYSEAELRATQDAVANALRGAQLGVGWSVGVGVCRLSDAVRVEVELFADSTPEVAARVEALLEPHGDKVRLAINPYGPPVTTALPLPWSGVPAPPPRAAPALSRHVSMAISRRCVRAKQLRIAARASQPAVRALSVTVAGRTRTIRGKRLRKPLVVALRGRRTKVAVTAQLAGGAKLTRTVKYTRCR